MATMRYYFNRNGAIVCGRDTREEAVEYALRSMGWDIYQGKDVNKDEFGGSHSVTYKVEEHELLPPSNPRGMSWKRTYNDTVLERHQAIHPFPNHQGAST